MLRCFEQDGKIQQANTQVAGGRHPLVKELRLYDIVGTEGVGADLSHINTDAKACVPSPVGYALCVGH